MNEMTFNIINYTNSKHMRAARDAIVLKFSNKDRV